MLIRGWRRLSIASLQELRRDSRVGQGTLLVIIETKLKILQSLGEGNSYVMHELKSGESPNRH